MERSSLDVNSRAVSTAVTDDTDKDIVQVRVDPVTNRVKVNIEPLDSATDSVTAIGADQIPNYDEKVVAYNAGKISSITYKLNDTTVATKTFT